jgi:AraC-like DNA-binding protein
MNTHGFNKNPSENDIDELFQELIPHGTPLFGVSVYETVNDTTREIMIHKHWHPELEILYAKENGLILELDSQIYHLEPGEIAFIPPGMIHSALQANQERSTFYAVVFDFSFISSYGMDIVQQQYLEPIRDSPETYIHIFKKGQENHSIIQMGLTQIIEAYEKGKKGFELLIKGELCRFFYYLVEAINEEPNVPKKQSDIINSIRIKKILTFINQNYQNKIYLKEIADELAISQQYFCRFFKKNFHMAFNTYLTQYRINRAEVLLQRTMLSVIDVAVTVGFDSANYFTFVFKEITGKTPSDYRKEWMSKEEN